MSDETIPPEMAGDAGTEPESVGSAETQGTEGGSDRSQVDPNDYEARIKSDPEFALAEVKRQQSAASRANDTLRKARLAIQLAEQVGGGDVEAGAQSALQELVRHRQLLQDPKMASLIQRHLNGEKIGDSFDDYDDEDPIKKEIAELRGTQARLEQQAAIDRYEKAMKDYFDSDIGKALTPEERDELFKSIDVNVRSWAQTPNGRKQLETFGVQQVRTLAASWLDSTGKLLEVGERAARAKAAAVKSRATDGPSRSTTIGPDTPPEAGDHLAAWEYAKRRMQGR